MIALPMAEQPRLCPVNHDQVFRPLPRFQVHIRFILPRRFLPQPVEIEVRVRSVLGRVVPPNLVIRPPIRRAEVDVLEAVPLDPERD
jgi:hypothetical protein